MIFIFLLAILMLILLVFIYGYDDDYHYHRDIAIRSSYFLTFAIYFNYYCYNFLYF